MKMTSWGVFQNVFSLQIAPSSSEIITLYFFGGGSCLDGLLFVDLLHIAWD
jgi:hypothetical protein